jgi:hypothetical protein
MKIRHILGGLSLVIVLLLAACSSDSPDLILEKQEVDLGQIVNGEVRDLQVSIENQGGADLIIEAVSTSCGCTSAEVVPSTILPGESGLLMISYDSGAHGPEANGPVMRQIFIASNDPDQPEIEFRLLADVLPPGS